MRKFLALFTLATLLVLGGLLVKPWGSYEPEARAASGAMFSGSDRSFHCSGTEIGKTSSGDGIFLTARHCVANTSTNKISENIVVSFSDNQGGPFYDAKPIALSLTDDLALLIVRNGANIPQVRIKDNRSLNSGDKIFNVSFPLGTGKELFHGEYMRPNFPTFPSVIASYPQWLYAMPMNMTIAHGSSGSGVFSEKQRGLIGVAVGTFEEGTYNIAIPADRVLDFLNDLKDNTVEKFMYAFPEKESTDMF